jgi:hypothetical protein
VILFDFDGTLFNTLPVYHHIKKYRLSLEQDILSCHRRFIERHHPHLEPYAIEWRHLFQKFSLHQLYIISESTTNVMLLYLEAFSLTTFITKLFGLRFSCDDSRFLTIQELLLYNKTVWLVSDNPSDLILKLEPLRIIDARSFHANGFSHFRQQIAILERTIFDN